MGASRRKTYLFTKVCMQPQIMTHVLHTCFPACHANAMAHPCILHVVHVSWAGIATAPAHTSRLHDLENLAATDYRFTWT